MTGPKSDPDATAQDLLDAFDESWPAETVAARRGWRLRAAPGAGRRVNSARPTAPHAALTADDLDVIEAFYAARAQPAMIQLAGAAAEEGAATELLSRGYGRSAESMLFEGRIADALEAGQRRGPDAIEVATRLAALDGVWREGDIDAPRRRVMERADPGCAAAFIARDGVELAGAVFACVVGERVFAHALHVREKHRRRSVGVVLMAAAAAFGRRLGAEMLSTACLTRNEGARRLFAAVHLKPVLNYAYFSAPTEAAVGVS